jgi:hypothetical protein
MTAEPDITVTVNFHREGAFALPALASLGDLVKVGRARGLAIETQAILDRPDELTRHIVDVRGRWLDAVQEVSFGDLGLSRNAGTRLAHGGFLAFLDGDDLWGEQWLRAAFEAATDPTASRDIIWHPEHLYVFSESDFDRASPTTMPKAGVESFHSLMCSSDKPGFNLALLIFDNLWSANAFASRELHVRFPYRAVDWSRGLGIEDWSWNFETLEAGIPHRIVPEAVHLIRKTGNQSLGQITARQLLPHLPASLVWGERSSRSASVLTSGLRSPDAGGKES